MERDISIHHNAQLFPSAAKTDAFTLLISGFVFNVLICFCVYTMLVQ